MFFQENCHLSCHTHSNFNHEKSHEEMQCIFTDFLLWFEKENKSKVRFQKNYCPKIITQKSHEEMQCISADSLAD